MTDISFLAIKQLISDFLEYIYPFFERIPKHHRFYFGDTVWQELLKMVESCNKKEKDEFIIHLKNLQFYFRLAVKEKIFNVTNYEQFSLFITKINEELK